MGAVATGKAHGEGCALFLGTRDRHGAAVPVDQVTDDRQAQAQPP